MSKIGNGLSAFAKGNIIEFLYKMNEILLNLRKFGVWFNFKRVLINFA